MGSKARKTTKDETRDESARPVGVKLAANGAGACDHGYIERAPTARSFIIDYQRLEGRLAALKESYRRASPFPHILLPGLVDRAALERAAAQFPDVGGRDWIQYTHFNERKFGKNDRSRFPPAIAALVDELQSSRFVGWLSRLTGIEGLMPDPVLDGGGLHASQRGGFLNIHTDFRKHHQFEGWQRRVNLILYLNPDWQEEWNGHLELWNSDMSACVRKYSPSFNHAVVFTTDGPSYHGHPAPLACPPGVARRSLALYYFTEGAESPESTTHGRVATDYQALPSDGALKVALIWADKQALSLYAALKRRFRLSDAFLSQVLRAIFPGKK